MVFVTVMVVPFGEMSICGGTKLDSYLSSLGVSKPNELLLIPDLFDDDVVDVFWVTGEGVSCVFVVVVVFLLLCVLFVVVVLQIELGAGVLMFVSAC
jgi:hypothetical protein